MIGGDRESQPDSSRLRGCHSFVFQHLGERARLLARLVPERDTFETEVALSVARVLRITCRSSVK